MKKIGSYIVLFLNAILLGLLVSCNSADLDFESYESSAELKKQMEVSPLKGTSIFAEAIRNISSEKSRKGSTSVKLDSLHKYGFKTDVVNLKKGAFVQACVWQHESYALSGFFCVLKSKKGEKLLNPNRFRFSGEEWVKLTHEIYIEDDSTTLDFYVFSGGNLAYFDDITIKKYNSIPTDSSIINLNCLELIIPTKSENLLNNYKFSALKSGVIGEHEKQWVEAKLLVKQDTLPVEIRLKGDWTDHLSSGKDSYRVKMDGNSLFMGMHSFSIQHPKTRNYMHAWWMHELCNSEDLLATKYDFLQVSINGTNKGVFAIEEHFEQELLTRSVRPIGPILKMDEAGLWEHTLKKKTVTNIQKYPVFEASVIMPFKKKKTLKNKQLKSDFIDASKLVNAYKSMAENPTEIFDIDQAAKYYALMELGNVQHGHQWHNKRFYYNPNFNRLESIGFDLNAGTQEKEDLYILKKIQSNKGPKAWQLVIPLLKNNDFRKSYLKYLSRFSSENYLVNRFVEFQAILDLNERLLALEIESYTFDKNYYLNRAESIREQIPLLDSVWRKFLVDNKPIESHVKQQKYDIEADSILLSDVSMNAYCSKNNRGEFSLIFENFHLNTINILGYESKNGKVIYFDEPIEMSSYSNTKNLKAVVVNSKPLKILFTAQNTGETLYRKEVYYWPRPSN